MAVFAGRKLRQYPLEFGTASRSETCAMAGVAEPLTAFLQALGYVGPVDIGLKWDERQCCYKLLDVNPRLGQNYRTFIGEARERADVGWLAYRELAEGTLAAGARPVWQRRRVWKVASPDPQAWRARLAAAIVGHAGLNPGVREKLLALLDAQPLPVATAAHGDLW